MWFGYYILPTLQNCFLKFPRLKSLWYLPPSQSSLFQLACFVDRLRCKTLIEGVFSFNYNLAFRFYVYRIYFSVGVAY